MPKIASPYGRFDRQAQQRSREMHSRQASSHLAICYLVLSSRNMYLSDTWNDWAIARIKAGPQGCRATLIISSTPGCKCSSWTLFGTMLAGVLVLSALHACSSRLCVHSGSGLQCADKPAPPLESPPPGAHPPRSPHPQPPIPVQIHHQMHQLGHQSDLLGLCLPFKTNYMAKPSWSHLRFNWMSY